MLLHKRNIKLLAASLLFPWLLGSCIDETLQECALQLPVAGEMPEGNYIISFNLDWDSSFSSGSRAEGDFVDGEHEEHDIRYNGLYALFFSDEDELLVNVVPMTSTHYKKDDDGKDVEFTEPETMEGMYYTTYSVKRGQIKPAKCLVVINGSDALIADFISSAKSENPYTLDQVLKKTWDDSEDARRIGHCDEAGALSSSNYSYLTMTNATYIDEDENLQCAVPVTLENNFVRAEWFGALNPYLPWDDITLTYIDEEDGEEKSIALKDKVLTIPVERMLAKFTFKIEPDENAQYDEATQIFSPDDNSMVVFTGLDTNGNHLYDSTSFHYAMKVTGWGINALETKNYLFRQISNSENYFEGWKGLGRCFWSEDPHYFKDNDYPNQYRKAADDPKRKYYSAKETFDDSGKRTANTNFLDNLSYTTMIKDWEDIVYAPENTYDNKNNYQDWSDYSESMLHKWVGTHVVVFGELDCNLNPGVDMENQHIFRDRNGIFYKNEKDYFKAMMQILHNDLTSQAEIHFTYHAWDGEGTYPDGTRLIVDTDGEWFLYYGNQEITSSNLDDIYDQIKNASKDSNCPATIEANVKNGDGQRILWYDGISIKDKNGNPLNLCTVDGVDNRGHTIKTHLGVLDDNLRKSLILEWIGAADHFNGGRMYYAAPVENVKLSVNKNYGVIRNTWYKFTLGNVTEIGYPIDNLDQPIVPNTEAKENQITFSVDIIGWHTIESDVPF